MTSILIVEDEKHIANGLRFNLEAEGFDVEIVENGRHALELLTIEEKAFDAVVLDIMLPEVDGFTIAGKMREAGIYTPILMLTARNRPEDVLLGFEAGTDDYLPKPFDLSIFMARLNGLLRRREWSVREKNAVSDSPVIKDLFNVNGKTIDFANLEIKSDGEIIQLTLMETKLLRHLIENAGNAVSRKTILEEVWELHEDTDTRAIDNFIVRLRRYLEIEPNNPQILQTVRGVGYKFVIEG